MNNTWRKAINAVLSALMIAGMSSMPNVLGNAAYAQSEGDVRTVQQETGTRTDSEANTTSAYDANTGVTTVRRKQDTVRLYNERTETYRQTGNRTETRYRQEPVYETRYRKEQRTRQEVQQVARTGYRQETRYETRYRPVYETKYRQVARTGYRQETQYRTEYEPIYRTEAYQDREAYTAWDWRWETRYRYEWQWITRYTYQLQARWYYSPGYWYGYWNSGYFIYPGCYWGSRWVSYWVGGYSYLVYEYVPVAYLSCELVSVPYLECVQYSYTAYRYVTRYRSVFSYWRPYTVAYTVTVPYTYYVTEAYQEQVYDIVGYRDVYGYTWVTETYTQWGGFGYPGCYWAPRTSTRQVWKYAYLGREPIYEPRQEAYQVPVTVTVAYTYYEPVTVTVTYYVDVPYQVQTGTRQVAYQVVVPVFGWVANGDWQAKEEITRTAYVTVGRIGSALLAAEAAGPARAKSSTFLSDSGIGNNKTQIAGSKKRLIFKADEVVASTAKVADVGVGSIRDTVKGKDDKDKDKDKDKDDKDKGKDDKDKDKDKDKGDKGKDDKDNKVAPAPNPTPTPAPQPVATPAPTPTPAPAQTTITADTWVGTWKQGNYTLTIKRTRSGIDYKFAVKNGGSWDNVLGGELKDNNTRFVDNVGGGFGTAADLTIEQVNGTDFRIRGKVESFGSDYSFNNLRK